MISPRLRRVILGTLQLRECELRDSTCAWQVPGWDSLSHVVILTAIENEYGVRFSTREIMGLNNLGDLQELIRKKTGDGF
jgi:acyl carrier protein